MSDLTQIDSPTADSTPFEGMDAFTVGHLERWLEWQIGENERDEVRAAMRALWGAGDEAERAYLVNRGWPSFRAAAVMAALR